MYVLHTYIQMEEKEEDWEEKEEDSKVTVYSIHNAKAEWWRRVY